MEIGRSFRIDRQPEATAFLAEYGPRFLKEDVHCTKAPAVFGSAKLWAQPFG